MFFWAGDNSIGRKLDSGADVIRVNFDRSIQAGELPAGAVFVAKALDESARELASMRLQRHGTFAVFELLPNFRALGSSTYRLRVYKGSQLLYESPADRRQPPISSRSETKSSWMRFHWPFGWRTGRRMG